MANPSPFSTTYICDQDLKKSGGIPTITANVAKIKQEAEKLDVMDKAAGILAELLYTDQLLTEIKEYRPIMLHVSEAFHTITLDNTYLKTFLHATVCRGQPQGPEVLADWI